MPAAYASHVRPRMSIRRRGDGVVVSGCDLVYPIPLTIKEAGLQVFCVIPCNPAYWTGTRIGRFAPAYMNYRPLSLTFSYIPQVAVTQQGTVYMGTLWNGAPSSEDLQQTLFTSNGGCLTQCYVPADTRIKLGTNLQQNLFTMAGPVNPNTSPFVFIAGVAGASVVPGYFYVTYSYELKNPIGSTWTYGRTIFTTITDIAGNNAMNRSLILLQTAAGYGPGTVMDMENEQDVFYNGTQVQLPQETQCILLWNEQTGNSVARLTRELTAARTITTIAGTDVHEFLQTSSSIPGNSLYVLISSSPQQLTISHTTTDITSLQGVAYYMRSTQRNNVSIKMGDGSVIIADLGEEQDQCVLKGFTLGLN